MQNTMTKAWELYEKGRAYNNSLEPNQYSLVNTNIAFYQGNQWLHMPDTPAMRRLPKPVFNIIKRVASLFVASLTSSGATIQFEPLTNTTAADEDAQRITAEVKNLLDKFKMEYRIREALFDGAQTGDYCAHFYFDPEAKPYGGALPGVRGEICMELVDGINVMFGNPADSQVERQPYILLLGRDTVENLMAEARSCGGDAESIQPDSYLDDMAGEAGQLDLHGDKALYVYLYTRDEAGKIRVTKATKTAVIYENVETGLSRYPIAWGNWEKQKNQYHGRALVTGIIPNQIFINTMFAMVMRHLQLMGFPKTVYNADLVGQWSNEIGQTIAVRGLQPGQPISQVAYNLQPADMSAQILTVIDRAVSYTKDCLGATDAQMGNVRPDNTSALMVLQSSAEVPLENTRAGLYEWLEDIGGILLDMMATYYGLRPMVRSRKTENGEEPVIELCDFSRFRDLWFKLRVDVGASSYFSDGAGARQAHPPQGRAHRRAQGHAPAGRVARRRQQAGQGASHRGRPAQRRQGARPAAHQHPGGLCESPGGGTARHHQERTAIRNERSQYHGRSQAGSTRRGGHPPRGGGSAGAGLRRRGEGAL